MNIASSLQQDRPWCSNAVVEIAYTFTHDGEGHVSAASATLVLGNITVDGSFTTLQQKFSVAWATAAAVTTSLEAGNVIPRAMSGNPGYIAGKSVLAGVLASDPSGSGKQAINAYVDGLLLNDCTGAMTVPVTFGDSTTFGCTLTLTEAQLETYCTDKTQLANFGFTPTYVAVVCCAASEAVVWLTCVTCCLPLLRSLPAGTWAPSETQTRCRPQNGWRWRSPSLRHYRRCGRRAAAAAVALPLA